MTVIYTINGFLGDMWQGPQAETGRHLSNQGLNIAYWQPIGYEAGRFPLSGGVSSGLEALRVQMNLHGEPFVMSAWSEGAIIQVLAYQAMQRGEPGWPSISNFKGATTFGNPYRQGGKYAPRKGVGAVTDPGGAGIGGPRNNLVGTPDNWHDYAHAGDMYCCCPTDQVGDDIRIIFDFVLTQWSGALLDLWDFAQSLKDDMLGGSMALVWAIVKAIAFYGGGTAEHTNYDPRPSMNYLAGIVRSLPR